jgi:NAD(P)-dependent dehydrogenase (short-subunit alcohol dehydrogenase family)
MKLANRTAVITGASKGLGFAVACAFAREGANLVLIARNPEDLRAAADSISENLLPGQKLAAHAADVTDEQAMRGILDAAAQNSGGIQILVNNAGIYGPIGPVEDNDMKAWRYAFEVNFYGTFNSIRVLMPHFKANNFGRIINLSGGGATKGMPGFSSYACSKAAVVRLTETAALEAAGLNITVNAVAPGALNTRMLDEALAAGAEKTGAQTYQALLKQKESGGSSPANAADLCVFLASQESAQINGRLISAVWDDWRNLAGRAEQLSKKRCVSSQTHYRPRPWI